MGRGKKSFWSNKILLAWKMLKRGMGIIHPVHFGTQNTTEIWLHDNFQGIDSLYNIDIDMVDGLRYWVQIG